MDRDAEQSWAGKSQPLTRRPIDPRTSITSFQARQRRKLAQAIETVYHRLDGHQRHQLEQLVQLVRNDRIDIIDAQRLLADVEYQLNQPRTLPRAA